MTISTSEPQHSAPRAGVGRLTRLTALAAVAVAGAALAVPAFAAESAPAGTRTAPSSPSTTSLESSVVTHTNVLTKDVTRLMKGSGVDAEQKALAAYWTPARMKAAKPLALAVSAQSLRLAQSAEAGTPQGLAGAVAPAKRTAPKPVEEPPGISPQYSNANLPYYHPAARTNGKVFFSRNGGNYVCSASIVNSEGKSLVWTAGHCLVDGKVWDSNFAFVPSYSNGSRPYGTWYSRTLTTTAGWYYNRDFAQDVGAATMYRSSAGYRIADYLGAQGLNWNQSANFSTSAFGYPQAYPFNGQSLIKATGSTGNAGNGTIYMYSGMTGGSSGGPWFRNFNGSWGWVNGHNDFIYTSSPNWMYSPYYGNQVASLYNAVRNQTS